MKSNKERGKHTQGGASPGVSCRKIKIKNKIKTGVGPIPDSPTVYRRKKTHRNNSNKAKQNKIAHVITVQIH